MGAGRSGLAVARAAKAGGGAATIYDQKSSEALIERKQTLQLEGIELVLDFDGRIDRSNADVLVTSPGVDKRSPLLVGAAADGVEVIGEIEFAYRISQAPIIAITGTNGKSTTTLRAYQILKALGHQAVLCGNIYGSGQEEIPLTEAAANSTPSQVLVAEISSFQLEWITTFRPRCAAITNIAQDHLNRYGGSFEEYAQTKRRIFSNMREGDTIVVDAGNPHTWPEWYKPGYSGRSPKVSEYDSRLVTAAIPTGRVPLAGQELQLSNLPFSEPHNVFNACVAALLVLGYDASHTLQEIERAFSAFTPLQHRLESLGSSRQGVELINNSMCTNPAAVVASSSSIQKRQHLIIGGITKGSDFTPVRKYLESAPHRAYIFGAEGKQINEQLGGSFPVFKTMAEAFEAAAENVRPGEVIMLAPGCASMDQYEDFRARGAEFRQLAKDWLNHDKETAH
jgi:UDP-N-acetylmuramoylalanine--D-glutamate ligase